MRRHSIALLFSACLIPLGVDCVHAQAWLETIKNKAAQEAVEHGSDLLHDSADGKVKCVAGDQACIDQARQQGKEVVVTNKKGKPLPPDQQPKSGSSASAGQSDTSTGAAAGSSVGQPNLTAVKSDFVPGDKLILYDDFTDMRGDEPPPHWKVRGGTAELRTDGQIRQLTLSNHAMRISPNVGKLPRNFTLEADYAFGPHAGNGNGFIWSFRRDPDGSPTMVVNVLVQESGATVEAQAGPIDQMEWIGRPLVQFDQKQPMAFAIWAQDGRIRIYIDGKRAVDVNQIALGDINYVDMDAGVDEEQGGWVGIRRARIAEAAPDFNKTIMSDRYVTRGILFDVDSDRIKPESAATIRMIASGMQASAGTSFLIEGHTDSTGDAAHNMDLSKRRAEAVKSALVSQFGIDAARLTTAGLGATKPVASNNTPQGKAENRRVEFVRQ
jgi:outer membrane protein OmpA-like peptidoglycan-associated protein